MILVNVPLALGWFTVYQGDVIWKIVSGYGLLGLGIGMMEGISGSNSSIDMFVTILFTDRNLNASFFVFSTTHHVPGRDMVKLNLF